MANQRRWLLALAATVVLADPAGGRGQEHHHHPPVTQPIQQQHDHCVGPAGRTYDLRWIDAMVQHHTAALRMSESVFHAGSPGIGALAHEIWREQAREIKAMTQWRKAWYPKAPVAPVTLKTGGNPDAMDDLVPIDAAQIEAMKMGSRPNNGNRHRWFLEGMLAHHGGALQMAHDALAKTRNPTIRRLARQIIVAQRREIIALRRMLNQDGLHHPAYHQFDALFSF